MGSPFEIAVKLIFGAGHTGVTIKLTSRDVITFIVILSAYDYSFANLHKKSLTKPSLCQGRIINIRGATLIHSRLCA